MKNDASKEEEKKQKFPQLGNAARWARKRNNFLCRKLYRRLIFPNAVYPSFAPIPPLVLHHAKLLPTLKHLMNS